MKNYGFRICCTSKTTLQQAATGKFHQNFKNFKITCKHTCMHYGCKTCVLFYSQTVSNYHDSEYYRISGIFGSDFNLAVWRICLKSPN